MQHNETDWPHLKRRIDADFDASIFHGSRWLLEQAAARLIRGIETDIAPAPSLRTVKARSAARARWDRDAPG